MVALWTKLTGQEVPFAKSKVKEQAKEFAAPLPEKYLEKAQTFQLKLKKIFFVTFIFLITTSLPF